MNLLIFLLLLLVVLIVVFRGGNDSVHGGEEEEITGSKEVKRHRSLKKGKVMVHSAQTLENFVNKATFKYRLVYVTGADLSGRTHLAQMLAKKNGFTYIDERYNGKVMSPPDIRKKFFVEVNGTTEAERAAQRSGAQKFIISGKWGVHDVKRLFKGEPINKNVSIIFIKPDEDAAAAWSKRTGKPKNEYNNVLAESDILFKELTTSYYLNVVTNHYKN